jgi:hypothetical protein
MSDKPLTCPKCGEPGAYLLQAPRAGMAPGKGHPYLQLAWAAVSLGKLAASQVARCPKCKHIWPAWRWV